MVCTDEPQRTNTTIDTLKSTLHFTLTPPPLADNFFLEENA
jgi:hypothetical protein